MWSSDGGVMESPEFAAKVAALTSSELDVMVAERVFGWVRDHDAESQTATGSPIWEAPGKEYLQNGTPDYSTDIAAAWLVVEKMRERGISMDLTGLANKYDQQWSCTFGDPETQNGECSDAASAPEAICRAALLAIESLKE
jgi:hypothetical protein